MAANNAGLTPPKLAPKGAATCKAGGMTSAFPSWPNIA